MKSLIQSVHHITLCPGRAQQDIDFFTGVLGQRLIKQKAIYEELGYTDASEIKDRFYFHSMYVRSPGGILVECTANVPGGFYKDETPENLGTSLLLPPWFEDQREAIVSQLEPITVPEENRPKAGARTVPPASVAGQTPAQDTAIPLSRYKATFAVDKQTTICRASPYRLTTLPVARVAAKCSSYHFMLRPIQSCTCLVSRIPCPSRG